MRKKQNDEMRGKVHVSQTKCDVPAISPTTIFRTELNEWFNAKIPFLFLSVQTALPKNDFNVIKKTFSFKKMKCNYNTKGRPR